ncbi:MAG: hypothetical protein WA738_17140 [Candidatus Angelobacter sp.]
MPDKKPPEEEKPEENASPGSGTFSLKPAGEMVLEHHDAPPPSGKQRIHDRRPLPLVPDRRPENKTPDDEEAQDPNSK